MPRDAPRTRHTRAVGRRDGLVARRVSPDCRGQSSRWLVCCADCRGPTSRWLACCAAHRGPRSRWLACCADCRGPGSRWLACCADCRGQRSRCLACCADCRGPGSRHLACGWRVSKVLVPASGSANAAVHLAGSAFPVFLEGFPAPAPASLGPHPTMGWPCSQRWSCPVGSTFEPLGSEDFNRRSVALDYSRS